MAKYNQHLSEPDELTYEEVSEIAKGHNTSSPEPEIPSLGGKEEENLKSIWKEATGKPIPNKTAESFTKSDSEKAPLAILFDTGKALKDVARVMSKGAEKYSRKNWKLVDDKERYISAPLRHLLAYQQGEFLDDELQLPHIACAITSLLFLLEIELKERKDDKV